MPSSRPFGAEPRRVSTKALADTTLLQLGWLAVHVEDLIAAAEKAVRTRRRTGSKLERLTTSAEAEHVSAIKRRLRLTEAELQHVAGQVEKHIARIAAGLADQNGANVPAALQNAAPIELFRIDVQIDNVRTALGEENTIYMPRSLLRPRWYSRRQQKARLEVALANLERSIDYTFVDNELENNNLETDVPNSPDLDFKKFFQSCKDEKRTRILLGHHAVPIWKHIKSDSIEAVKTGDTPNDGDMFTDADYVKVKALLQKFRHAYNTFCPQDTPGYPQVPHIEQLDGMQRICLLLKYTSLFQYIDHLLLQQCKDRNLPLEDKEDFYRYFGSRDIVEAEHFIDQQYRVYRRSHWRTSSHRLIPLGPNEPVPFRHRKSFPGGYFSKVDLVQDVHSSRFYIRKQPNIISSADHLLNELERLKRLRKDGQDHHHLVKLHCAFSRTHDGLTIIMERAKSDLSEVLAEYPHSYHKPNSILREEWPDNKFYPDFEQGRLRAILLYAFGCLSHGLTYLHESNIRHKDVKPNNILVNVSSPSKYDDIFWWTDFGLAHDYNDPQLLAMTRDPNRQAHLYSSPEVLSSWKAAKKRNKSQSASGAKKAEGSVLEEDDVHHTSDDVFSLGLIYLVTLVTLMDTSHQRPDPSEIVLGFQCKRWAEELDKMYSWIDLRIQGLSDNSFQPPEPLQSPRMLLLLRLTRMMLHEEPRRRPSARQVRQAVLEIDDSLTQEGGSHPLILQRTNTGTISRCVHFCGQCTDEITDEKDKCRLHYIACPPPTPSFRHTYQEPLCTGNVIKDCFEPGFTYTRRCYDEHGGVDDYADRRRRHDSMLQTSASERPDLQEQSPNA